jgi:hypothetical protein
MISDCGKTVTKILNGGGGLSLDLLNGASQLFPRAAIFSAYGMCVPYQLALLVLQNHVSRRLIYCIQTNISMKREILAEQYSYNIL